MNQNFKKGMIVKLEENSDKKYVILENMSKDNKEYILLTDCEGEIDLKNKVVNNMKVDFSKLFMVCYDKENDTFSYDSNREIITTLIKRLL